MLDKEIAMAAVTQNGFALKICPQFDYDVNLQAVTQNGLALQYSPLNYIPNIISQALSQNGEAIQFVDSSYLTEPLMAIKAVQQNGMSLEYLPKFQLNHEFALTAIKENGMALQFCANCVKLDKALNLLAVKNDGFAYEFVHHQYKFDKDIYINALSQNHNVFHILPFQIQNIAQVVEIYLKGVLDYSQQGFYEKIKQIDSVFNEMPAFQDKAQKVKDILQIKQDFENGFLTYNDKMRDLITEDPTLIKYLNQKPSIEWEHLKIALLIQANPLIYQYLPESLQKQERFAIITFQLSGKMLKYAPQCIKRNKKLVLIALNENKDSIYYAASEVLLEISPEKINDGSTDLAQGKLNTMELEKVKIFPAITSKLKMHFGGNAVNKGSNHQQDNRNSQVKHSQISNNQSPIYKKLRGQLTPYSTDLIKGILKKLISLNFFLIQQIPEYYMINQEILNQVIQYNGLWIQCLPPNFRRRALIDVATKQNKLSFLFHPNPDIIQDKQIILDLIKTEIHLVPLAKLFNDDFYTMKIALEKDPDCIKFLKGTLKDNAELALIATNIDIKLLKYFNSCVIENQKVSQAIIQQYNLYTQKKSDKDQSEDLQVPKKIKVGEELTLESPTLASLESKNNNRAFLEELLNNKFQKSYNAKDIYLKAIELDFEILNKFVPQDMQDDPDLVLVAVKQNWIAILSSPSKFVWKNSKIMEQVLLQKPSISVYQELKTKFKEVEIGQLLDIQKALSNNLTSTTNNSSKIISQEYQLGTWPANLIQLVISNDISILDNKKFCHWKNNKTIMDYLIQRDLRVIEYSNPEFLDSFQVHIQNHSIEEKVSVIRQLIRNDEYFQHKVQNSSYSDRIAIKDDLKFLDKHKLLLKSIPKKILNQTIMEILIDKFETPLQYLPKAFIEENLAQKAIDIDVSNFQYIPKFLITYKMAFTVLQKDTSLIRFIPKEIIDNQLAKMLVELNALSLKYIPNEFIDSEMVHKAIDLNVKSFCFVPQNFITYEIAQRVVKQDAELIEFVPKEYIDYDIIQKAIKYSYKVLKYIPNEILTFELAKQAIKYNCNAIQYIPNNLITQELAQIAIDQSIVPLKYIPCEFIDYDMTRKAILEDPLSLEFIPKTLITEKLANLAIQNNPQAIKFLPQNVLNTTLISKCIQSDPLTLKHVPKEFITQDLANKALNLKPECIEFIPKNIIDIDMVQTVIDKNIVLLKYVPQNLIDQQLAYSAIDLYPSSLKYLPKNLVTQELVEIALNQEPSTIKIVPKDMITKVLAELAVDADPEFLEFIPSHLITYDMALKAVSKLGRVIQYVPKQLLNVDLAVTAFDSNDEEYQQSSKQLLEIQTDSLTEIPIELIDKNFALKAFLRNKNCFKSIPQEYITRIMAKKALEFKGQFIQHVPTELLDKELIETSIKNNSIALQFVPKSMLTQEILRIGLQYHGDIIRYIPKDMLTTELIWTAFNYNSLQIESRNDEIMFVIQKLPHNKDDFKTNESDQQPQFEKFVDQSYVVRTIIDFPQIIKYIPTNLFTKNLQISIVRQDGLALKHIKLKDEYDLVYLAVQKDGLAIQFASENLKNNESIRKVALQQNSQAIKFLDEEQLKDLQIGRSISKN